MAYVCKHPKSPYWTAVFRDETGSWMRKSTKKVARSQALTLALEWERAGKLGRERVLTEAVSHEVIAGILERSTGETLRHVTVRTHFLEWLKGKSRSKSTGTSTRYEGTVTRFLKWLGPRADSPLKAISPRDLQLFNDELLGQKLAPYSVIVEIKTLRAAFNAGRRLGLITVNPASAVELPERVTQVRRKTFTPAQVQRLLDQADAEWRTVILLGYYCGLRLSDATALTWENVDFTNRKLVLEIKKTGDHLELPLHPSLEHHLQALAGDKGGPLSPELASVSTSGRSGLSRRFLAVMTRAEISNESKDIGGQRSLSQLSFHALRTSFNSALHNQGVSQEVRKKLTGHKSDAVNDRYTRTEMDTLREAVSKLPHMKPGVE